LLKTRARLCGDKAAPPWFMLIEACHWAHHDPSQWLWGAPRALGTSEILSLIGCFMWTEHGQIVLDQRLAMMVLSTFTIKTEPDQKE
jgi:hypothetical protein